MALDPEDREWLETKFGEVHARMDTALHGPEGEPQKGLHVRMDRLEQLVRAFARLTWLGVGAEVAALIGMFTHHSTPPGNHP